MRIERRFAGIAQLVEHNLAKVGVASSSLVSRSNISISSLHSGWVAEWLCSGLQSRVPRFDSGLSLQIFSFTSLVARVVELVDTRDLNNIEHTGWKQLM